MAIRTFKGLDGSIFWNDVDPTTVENPFAAMPFDEFTDLGMMLSRMPTTIRDKTAKTIGEMFNITLP